MVLENREQMEVERAIDTDGYGPGLAESYSRETRRTTREKTKERRN